MKIIYYFKNSQLIKYMITGAVSFAIDYAVYWIFSYIVHYEIATMISLLAGLCVNYVMSKFWVFSNNAPISKRELFTFITLTAAGFALTALGMFVGVDLMRVNDKLVKFVVALIIFVINYIVRKYIIFKND